MSKPKESSPTPVHPQDNSRIPWEMSELSRMHLRADIATKILQTFAALDYEVGIDERNAAYKDAIEAAERLSNNTGDELILPEFPLLEVSIEPSTSIAVAYADQLLYRLGITDTPRIEAPSESGRCTTPGCCNAGR